MDVEGAEMEEVKVEGVHFEVKGVEVEVEGVHFEVKGVEVEVEGVHFEVKGGGGG